MIVLLNGAFGIGKTTVARLLARRMRRAVVFDPEPIGVALQRVTRVDDFQDLALWRRLLVLGVRITRAFAPTVIVPMAFSNERYLDEIRTRLLRRDPDVRHICLVAPLAVVHARLRGRGEDPVKGAWQYLRAAECCAAHESEAFAQRVDATRDPEEIADEVMRMVVS